MISTLDTANFALEPQSLGSLRLAAKKDPQQSLRAVAQQFESVFLNILMKSMRSTVQSDGPFNSDQTRMYTELMDQQVAEKIAKQRGLGIADMLVKQLSQSSAAEAPVAGLPIPLHRDAKPVPLKKDSTPIPFKSTLPGSDMIPLPASMRPQATSGAAATPKEFVGAIWDHAVKAGQELGVAPNALVAQAALESGWGSRKIKMPDGSASHNLFGVKAGADWQGKVAESTTSEYVNGTRQTRVARFRAYDSYEAAFKDYADLLKTSPRYAKALGASDANQFAGALQQAGYATDPAYATKLGRIMASAVMRQALTA